MTVTVITGFATETDSTFAAETRGLKGQVFKATATLASDPYIYQDFVRDPDVDDIYLEFDLDIPHATFQQWNSGNREAQLFSLQDADTEDVVVDLWVKRYLGRYVWYISTDLGGGDTAYGTHLVTAGTHRIFIHVTDTAGTVTLPLDSLAVTL